jgi:hypothetical protein
METLVLMLVGKVLSEPRRFLPPVAVFALVFSGFAAFLLLGETTASGAGQILLVTLVGMLWLFVAQLVFRVRRLAQISEQTEADGLGLDQTSSSPLLWSAALTPHNDVSKFQFLAASSDGLMVWKVDSLYRDRFLEAARLSQNPSWLKPPTHLFTWDKVNSITSKGARLSINYQDLGGKQKTVRLESSPSTDPTILRLADLGWDVSGKQAVQVAGKSVVSVVAFVIVATAVCGTLFLSVSDLVAKAALAAVWLLGVPLLSWAIWTDNTVKPGKLEAVPVSPTRPRLLQQRTARV